jgi:hypothetical protein
MQKIGDLKGQAVALLDRLEKHKLRTAVDFLSYLRDREGWEATWELTSDPGIAASLRRSKEDARKGRVKAWKDIKRHA